MKKLTVCALGAAVLLSSLGITACGKGGTERGSYSIVAEYFPEERKLTAEMNVTVPNGTENALEELKFELWANAYREGAKYSPVSELYAPSAYYNGMSYGGIEVTAVNGAESFSVCGEDENILGVKLKEPLYPDETATLSMTFTVTLAEINHRLGVGENTVNLAAFYPVLCHLGENGFAEYVYSSNGDPFVSECADYEITLTVPEAYTAAYGGTGEEVAENGKKTYHVVAENARDTAFVLGTEFKKLTRAVNGVAVEYYYLSDLSPEKTLATAAESLEFFSDRFGKYASPRYAVVQTDFPYGGMEFAGLSMISNSLRETEIAHVVVHETAHQWWYATVGSNQFENAWQDEGLAEFSTALFFGAFPDYGKSYADLVNASVKSYRAFYSVHSQVSGNTDTSMNRPLTAFSGDYEYRNIAYDKGVILFDRIKSETGDKKFDAALRRYCEKFRGKIARYEDMVACFEAAGCNAAGIFDSFVKGLCVI
jgi:hypothetical protein